jgi:uncharacterized protein (TIGR02246 family)
MTTDVLRTALVISVLAGAAPVAVADEAADRAALAAASESWIAAINARDAGAMAALATEDVVLLNPDSSPVAGREKVRKAWEQSVAAAPAKITVTTKESVVAGDYAWTINAFTHELPNGVVASGGQSLQIWKRVDRRWKIHRETTPGVLAGARLRPGPPPNEPVLDRPAD